MLHLKYNRIKKFTAYEKVNNKKIFNNKNNNNKKIIY